MGLSTMHRMCVGPDRRICAAARAETVLWAYKKVPINCLAQGFKERLGGYSSNHGK